MPLFEYQCRSCKKVFELLHLAGREVKKACPSCGSADILQRISVFAARASNASAGDVGGNADGETCRRCGNEPGSCAMDPE